MALHEPSAGSIADDKSEHDRELGMRLRSIRKSKGRSMREIALDAGVSESFLSQVERGIASPSVASLRRICIALGESMGALFDDLAPHSTHDERLVRVGDRRRIYRPDGSADYLITPHVATQLEVHHNIISPHRSSGPEPYTHLGEEECVYVLQGSLTLTWDGADYELGAGDAMLIDPKVGHRFANNTDEPAIVLWIISPANQDI